MQIVKRSTRIRPNLGHRIRRTVPIAVYPEIHARGHLPARGWRLRVLGIISACAQTPVGTVVDTLSDSDAYEFWRGRVYRGSEWALQSCPSAHCILPVTAALLAMKATRGRSPTVSAWPVCAAPGHCTFGLSPDFLAARLLRPLAKIEETIFAVAHSPSIEAAEVSVRD